MASICMLGMHKMLLYVGKLGRHVLTSHGDSELHTTYS